MASKAGNTSEVNTTLLSISVIGCDLQSDPIRMAF